MAAVTTVPGPEAWARATRPRPPRVATPRGRRTSHATYVRRRVAIAALALGVVVVAGQAGGALGSSPLTAPGRRPTASSSVRTVVVQPGDTLWGIAERLAPGQDPRPIVDQLASVYGDQPLQPGQVLHWGG